MIGRVVSITKLQRYFPVLRENTEILEEIMAEPNLQTMYESWTKRQQKEFLDFCSGARGVKMLYDSFFKEVMNPEYAPERLNSFLSLLLKRKVTVLYALPNDSTRIADESSLLVTDIVVELDDGSIANVEIQKIGYRFPGQRCACYSADLLLRQYKRIRNKKQKQSAYKDIKSVYTIILFEKSPKEFHTYTDTYLHYFQQQSDTGLKLELLQKYLFIPLDIFKKKMQNKPIKNKVDAWLTFFSRDEPETIIRLIETYPEFRPLYNDVYSMCQNMERVMGMFSRELLELDRNTVQYMIDEMQETIDEQQETISGQRETIHVMQGTIGDLQGSIEFMEQKYRTALEEIKHLKKQ